MNTITLGQEEVVVSGDEDIVFPTESFVSFANGIINGHSVKDEHVSMDVGETEVYFYTNDMMIEVSVPRQSAIDIALSVL